jgi:hypothetical protein
LILDKGVRIEKKVMFICVAFAGKGTKQRILLPLYSTNL